MISESGSSPIKDAMQNAAPKLQTGSKEWLEMQSCKNEFKSIGQSMQSGGGSTINEQAKA